MTKIEFVQYFAIADEEVLLLRIGGRDVSFSTRAYALQMNGNLLKLKSDKPYLFHKFWKKNVNPETNEYEFVRDVNIQIPYFLFPYIGGILDVMNKNIQISFITKCTNYDKMEDIIKEEGMDEKNIFDSFIIQ